MSSLAQLGDLAPAPMRRTRNANPGSKDYNYVREYITLKRWALDTYGQHDGRGFENTFVPRIPRRDALTMTRWWEDVTKDIEGTDQHSREVSKYLTRMQIPVYGSEDAATRKITPTEAELARELTYSEAAHFWYGMSWLSTSIGPAKMRPTLFDKGQLLWESVIESAADLPERIIDQGKKLGEDFQTSIDRLITAAKWTGAIGGGLLAVYVITRIAPERPSRERK